MREKKKFMHDSLQLQPNIHWYYQVQVGSQYYWDLSLLLFLSFIWKIISPKLADNRERVTNSALPLFDRAISFRNRWAKLWFVSTTKMENIASLDTNTTDKFIYSINISHSSRFALSFLNVAMIECRMCFNQLARDASSNSRGFITVSHSFQKRTWWHSRTSTKYQFYRFLFVCEQRDSEWCWQDFTHIMNKME